MLKETEVHKEHKGFKVLLGQLGLKAKWDPKGLKVVRELQEILVLRVIEVLKVHKVAKERLEVKVLKGT